MTLPQIDLFDIFRTTKSSETKAAIDGKVLTATHLMRVHNAIVLGICPELECRSICRVLPSDVDIDQRLSELFSKTLKSKKVARLAGNIEDCNRHHLIWFHLKGTEAWWAITYTLDDLWARRERHWYAPHVHMTTHLSQPTLNKDSLVELFLREDKPHVPHDFYIRFQGDIGQEMRFG